MANAEGELLTRYAQGKDAEAFRLLVEQHQDMVFATCRRILRNAADAEDAAQDAFLQLARHAGRLRPPVAAWLHRVAVHAAGALLRRNRSHYARELHSEADVRAATEPEWEEIKTYIDAAIAALPGSLRQAVVMHYLEGRRQEDVAKELGITQSAVSKRLDRGVAELRRRLKKSGVSISASALTPLLFAHAIEKAPSTLTTALGKIGLAGIGSAGKGAATWGGSTMMKVGIAACALAVAVGVTLMLARRGTANAPTPIVPAAPVTAPPSAVPKVEELIKLVEAQEKLYERSRASYQITSGMVKEATPDVAFTAGTPRSEVIGDYGYDAVKGYQYVKEDHFDGMELGASWTSAFDGKVGTFVMPSNPQTPTTFIGSITSTRPNDLKIGMAGWRPVQSTFWPIPNVEMSISEMLRKGKVIEIVPETMAGRETYRIKVECSVPHMTIRASGEEFFQLVDTYRFWLDPARNMLPVRIDKVFPPRRDETRENLITKYQGDFREVRPGLWFPYRALCIYYPEYRPSGTVYSADSVVVKDVALGDDAQVPPRVEFPVGTYVQDDITHIRYRASASAAKDAEAPQKQIETERRVTVKGRALDDAGGAVQGASVRLSVHGPTSTITREFTGYTDEEGRFEIPALIPPGPWIGYDVWVSARPDYADVFDNKYLDPPAAGDDVTLPDFAMLRADASLSGVVVDPTGKPAPHVPVYLNSLDSSSSDYTSAAGMTDDQGNFRFDHVCKRPLSIGAGYGRDEAALGFAHVMGGDQNITVTLGKASAAAP